MVENLLGTGSPFSLIIFGGSGHLAKLKIYPALYTLALKKRLPNDYAIVGYARSDMTDESFRALVEKSVRDNMPAVTDAVLTEFLTHVHYHQGQYDQKDDFAGLQDRIAAWEERWSGDEPVRVAYLSIPPSVFTDVVGNLCAGGIRGPRPFRCIVEKPVGHDLKSAEEVWTSLSNCFDDNEIYLLDHYLGKEAVRNVYYLRFANPIVERLLKNTLIHHIEIGADESAGLEGRAGYFEGTGTFRDMVQSHLLQIASLLTMRLKEETESFRESRLNALSQFYLPAAADLNDVVLQGQYGSGQIGGKNVPAYLEEEGVAPGSRTNTFVAIKLLTRISRFDGVPFYFHTGKRLEQKETYISIHFQESTSIGTGATPNRLDIILQGEAGMRLYLQTKLGGTEPRFRPLIMTDPLVCVGDCLPEHCMLILEAIHGNQQWFLSMDEVRSAWRLADPVQAHLEKPDTPLHVYEPGKHPEEGKVWLEKHGITWSEE